MVPFVAYATHVLQLREGAGGMREHVYGSREGGVKPEKVSPE